MLSHRTEVSLTPWCGAGGEDGRQQALQAQAFPAARGEHILMELAHACPPGAPCAPAPRPGAAGGCLGTQLPEASLGPLSRHKNASVCLLGLEWAEQPF